MTDTIPQAPGTDSLTARLDKLYEFERAPVTPDKLHDGRYFAGLFAGEHVAATEFVIGALFVQWGASARNLILGLLIGNFLAVLSWAFICAPIAVRTRLTLYWYARRIIGPGLTVVYNVVNAMLYCALAAAMIGVSASAVILALTKFKIHITHPALTDVYPNSAGWVVVVLLVGAVTTVLAIMGFKRLSQFAAVCSPWMFLIFIAGALATLPRLGEIHSLADLWNVAQTKIWLETPRAGTERLGFWHIAFFAWFCNLAMHVGLSDMAIFRYAKRWTYGFYSVFGMYLGHYLAWICAGIMGAAVSEGLNPGQMADLAVGLAGVLAVLIAGWTTANPTIYRAGLALQIATPNWPRWAVTLAAGAVTTLVGLFPVIFMKLLDFVALYGLSLMPIGAIIFTEHWLFPRLGLRQYWTERQRQFVNVPALVTWMVVIAICFPWETFLGFDSPMAMVGVHLFFRWLPGWFIAAGLYVALCYLMPGARAGGPLSELGGQDGARDGHRDGRGRDGETESVREGQMGASGGLRAETRDSTSARPVGPATWAAGAVALLSLVACVVLPAWVFAGGSEPAVYDSRLAAYKAGMIVATAVYFIASTYYAAQREKGRAGE